MPALAMGMVLVSTITMAIALEESTGKTRSNPIGAVPELVIPCDDGGTIFAKCGKSENAGATNRPAAGNDRNPLDAEEGRRSGLDNPYAFAHVARGGSPGAEYHSGTQRPDHRMVTLGNGFRDAASAAEQTSTNPARSGLRAVDGSYHHAGEATRERLLPVWAIEAASDEPGRFGIRLAQNTMGGRPEGRAAEAKGPVPAASAAPCRKLPEAPKSAEYLQRSSEYRIGSGDALEILVWRNESLSIDMPVRPDGLISVPLVGDITAEGKTPAKLARELEGKLADFIQDPQVTIIVSDSVGSLRDRIRVIGGATEPRVMAYRVHMTILDVLIEIGGLSEFADGNGSILIRREDSQQKQYCVRLDDLLRDGDMSADVDMIPGDVLIIPLRAGSPGPQD